MNELNDWQINLFKKIELFINNLEFIATIYLHEKRNTWYGIYTFNAFNERFENFFLIQKMKFGVSIYGDHSLFFDIV